MPPQANDSMVKPVTAAVVESLNLNHLIGLVIAREISKEIRSKQEKLDSGRSTSPDLASPTSQPANVTQSRKKKAATEHTEMPRQWFLNAIGNVTRMCCLTIPASNPAPLAFKTTRNRSRGVRCAGMVRRGHALNNP
jgi:hypothetical protein